MTIDEQLELIKQSAGCHVLVYAGDGNGQPAELLFESRNSGESRAICNIMRDLLKQRAKTYDD